MKKSSKIILSMILTLALTLGASIGVISVSASESTEPVAPVEPDPAPVVDPEPVNPSTADVSGLFYILAAASAVCGCFLTKKN